MASVEQRGIKTSRDKQGGVTLTKSWVVDTLEETQTVGDEFVMGMPEEDRSSVRLENGRHEVTINYKGAADDTKPEQEKWSGKLSFREDPIQAHPNWAELRDTYGWVDEGGGKGHFPEDMPAGRGTATGLSGGKPAAGKKNPMFGAKTFPVLIGEVTHGYVRKALPGDLLDRVGRVLESLPSSSGIATPAGYAWLTQTPEFDQEGNSWRIVDHYKLLPEDGYLAVAYKLIKR